MRHTSNAFDRWPIPVQSPSMNSGHIVAVNLPGQEYKIHVKPGVLNEAGAILRELRPQIGKVGIMTDTVVDGYHLKALQQALLKSDITQVCATVPSGETYKTLETLLPVFTTFLQAKIDRQTPVLALGGGVIGDMAGFVAASILRGVPFVQIPTTLLSMVDASVGGKTGINHSVGKNLIGAFHQPIAVLADPMTLQTLPARELRGGLAECIKHDCIRDAAGFADLEKNIPRALDLDIDYLTDLVAHNVEIKARVVEADQFEKGERAHLNFGHTFGHAIESVSRYEYSHGEAVALGMTAAVYTSAKLGLLSEIARQRIVDVIRIAKLPTTGMRLKVDDIIDNMFFDKKVKDGKLRFILLDKIGHAIVRDDVPMELVREAVESLQ